MTEYLLRAGAALAALILAGAIPLQVYRNQPLSLYSLGIAITVVFLGAAAAGSKVDFSYADGKVSGSIERLEQQVAAQDEKLRQTQDETKAQTARVVQLENTFDTRVQAAVAPIKSKVADAAQAVTNLDQKYSVLSAAVANNGQQITLVSGALGTITDSLDAQKTDVVKPQDLNKIKQNLRAVDKLKLEQAAPQ